LRIVIADPQVAQDSMLRLEILAEASRNPEIAAVVKAADERLVAAMSSLIARYQAKGELHAEIKPDAAARLIISLYDGLIGRVALGEQSDVELITAADKFITRALEEIIIP